ncbi:MAG: ParA family protein [Candidatus Binatia bacterium]
MEDGQPLRKTWVIAVGNQKGGVGKTTNTVHIATALCELGRKCLIWDLDMNHGATLHFGIPSESFLGTYEILMGDENPEDLILTNEDEGIELPQNLDLIPARRNLENIDEALAARDKFINKPDVLIEPLNRLRGRYDYIFLDTAPNATTPTIAAYKAADLFILSALPETFAIAGLNDALADIDKARRRGNKNLRLLGVVVSCTDKRTTLSTQLTHYVEEIFGPDGRKSAKFDGTISRAVVIPKAQKVGKTIFQTNSTHKVTDEYRQLAREIEARIEEFKKDHEETPVEPNHAVVPTEEL